MQSTHTNSGYAATITGNSIHQTPSVLNNKDYTSTYTVNGTAYTHCFRTDGKCNGASSVGLSKFTWFLMLMLMSLTCAMQVGTNVTQASQLFRVDSVDEALEHHLQTFGAVNGSLSEYYITDTDTLIDQITYGSGATNSSLSKRWTPDTVPLGTWFHQTQVAQQGVWWTPWYAASGCFWDGYGTSGASTSMSWSQTQTETLSAGFNFNFGKQAALNVGYEVSKSVTESNTATCPVDPWQEVVQVWSQKRMLWQDQQKQLCVKWHYGKGGLHCNAWGPYIHGDMPVKEGFITACSAGRNNVHC